MGLKNRPEVLEWARKKYAEATDVEKKNWEFAFPELKESEDERIRKHIVKFLLEADKMGDAPEEVAKWLAYLEKQKEPNKVLRLVGEGFLPDPDAYLEVVSEEQKEQKGSLRVIKDASEWEKIKEQKPVEKQDYADLNDMERAIHRGFLAAGVENVPVAIIKETAKECLAQMKPVEWSAYDKATIEYIIEDIKELRDEETDEEVIDTYDRELNLLQCINDSVKLCNYTNPAEWSEEDETRLTNILIMLKEFAIRHYSKDDVNKSVDWLENRVKFLRHQPKQDVLPSLSEKEIICLKRALDYLRKEHNRYGGEGFTNEIVVLEWLITHPILVSDTHWKPSEEQMKALEHCVNGWQDTADGTLESLYNDLKKL